MAVGKMTKPQLVKRVQLLSREYANIKADYTGVMPEDMPEDVTAELAELLREMKEIRAELTARYECA
jgi:hypothetical protein